MYLPRERSQPIPSDVSQLHAIDSRRNNLFPRDRLFQNSIFGPRPIQRRQRKLRLYHETWCREIQEIVPCLVHLYGPRHSRVWSNTKDPGFPTPNGSTFARGSLPKRIGHENYRSTPSIGIYYSP